MKRKAVYQSLQHNLTYYFEVQKVRMIKIDKMEKITYNNNNVI